MRTRHGRYTGKCGERDRRPLLKCQKTEGADFPNPGVALTSVFDGAVVLGG